MDTINLTAKVDLIAEESEGNRPSFKIVGYTGALMRVPNFASPVIVDLSGLKADRERIPALLEHDTTKLVGMASPTIGPGGVFLEGTITGDNEHTREVITHAKNGFEWQASIGAAIGRQEFVKTGNSTTVNGRTVTGPALIARESTLKEISFVPIGADGQTSATVAAASSLDERGSTMTPEEKAAAEKQAAEACDQLKQAMMPPKMKAEDDEADDTDTEASGKAKSAARLDVKAATLEELVTNFEQETARRKQINDLTASYKLAHPLIADVIDQMGQVAIRAQATTRDQYELALVRATRGQTYLQAGGFAITGTAAAPASQQQVIEAAACKSGGLDASTREKEYPTAALELADKQYKYGITLREILLTGARERGYHRWDGDVERLLRAAFPSDGMIRAEGSSTYSVPTIISNIANKFLFLGFRAVEDAWRQVSALRTVNDFKQITTVGLTGGLMYEQLGPAGEIKHGTVSEIKYNNQAGTYAKTLAIRREDIINDDLGALTGAPIRLGRGGALKINDVFWTVFMSNLGTTFTSARSNYLSGVTVGTNDSRLNIEGLTRAETSFLNQTDPDGYPLALTPRKLLVPTALNATASQLMRSAEVRDTTANTNYGTVNPHAGKFDVVYSTYLSNSSYTGYSTTAWYLLATPADLPIIEVAFLNGRDVPLVETAMADFDTLGIQMRGYIDFGVAIQEYRAGVMSKGAA